MKSVAAEDIGWGRSEKAVCGLLLGVFPAHPNLIRIDFFKWGKIFVSQWLAEISP